MGNTIDVLVVGGGPAGLAAAIAARKKGFPSRSRMAQNRPSIKPVAKDYCAAHLRPSRTWRPHADRRRADLPSHSLHSTDPSWPKRNSRVRAASVSGGRFCTRRCREGQTMWCSIAVKVPGNGHPGRWRGRGRKSGSCKVDRVGADGVDSRVRAWSGVEAGFDRKMRFAYRRHYRASLSSTLRRHLGNFLD